MVELKKKTIGFILQRTGTMMSAFGTPTSIQATGSSNGNHGWTLLRSSALDEVGTVQTLLD